MALNIFGRGGLFEQRIGLRNELLERDTAVREQNADTLAAGQLTREFNADTNRFNAETRRVNSVEEFATESDARRLGLRTFNGDDPNQLSSGSPSGQRSLFGANGEVIGFRGADVRGGSNVGLERGVGSRTVSAGEEVAEDPQLFKQGGQVKRMKMPQKLKQPGYAKGGMVKYYERGGVIGDVSEDNGQDTVDAKVREGEYLLNPETVAYMGGGDYQNGVRSLDAMVKMATGREPGPEMVEEKSGFRTGGVVGMTEAERRAREGLGPTGGAPRGSIMDPGFAGGVPLQEMQPNLEPNPLLDFVDEGTLSRRTVDDPVAYAQTFSREASPFGTNAGNTAAIPGTGLSYAGRYGGQDVLVGQGRNGETSFTGFRNPAFETPSAGGGTQTNPLLQRADEIENGAVGSAPAGRARARREANALRDRYAELAGAAAIQGNAGVGLDGVRDFSELFFRTEDADGNQIVDEGGVSGFTNFLTQTGVPFEALTESDLGQLAREYERLAPLRDRIVESINDNADFDIDLGNNVITGANIGESRDLGLGDLNLPFGFGNDGGIDATGPIDGLGALLGLATGRQVRTIETPRGPVVVPAEVVDQTETGALDANIVRARRGLRDSGN